MARIAGLDRLSENAPSAAPADPVRDTRSSPPGIAGEEGARGPGRPEISDERTEARQRQMPRTPDPLVVGDGCREAGLNVSTPGTAAPRVGWRRFRGCALVVDDASTHLYRLNAVATRIWEPFAAGQGSRAREVDLASFVRSMALAESRPRPRVRRVAAAWELCNEIAPGTDVRTRRIGRGFVVTSLDGELTLLRDDGAALWRLITLEPRTYSELLDATTDRLDVDYAVAEAAIRPLVADMAARHLVSGLEDVKAVRQATVGAGGGQSRRPADGARDRISLGFLGRSRMAVPPSRPPALGSPPVLRDPGGEVSHVAIVCQYGIHGLAPEADVYTAHCIERVSGLAPDLLIVSGGGRHGVTTVREAESVAESLLTLLPRCGLWVEKHSATTWENLRYSLEMLAAREVVPRRISLLCDRRRFEKTLLCSLIARRRFTAFADTAIDIVPVRRSRVTWRDNRLLQAILGIVQVVRESRRTPMAAGHGMLHGAHR